jgi:hypothetical protein
VWLAALNETLAKSDVAKQIGREFRSALADESNFHAATREFTMPVDPNSGIMRDMLEE